MELIKISQLEEQSEAKPNQYTIITDDDNVSKKIDIGTKLLNALPFWKIPQIEHYDDVKQWYKIGRLTRGMVSFSLRAGTLGSGLVFDKNCILGVDYRQGYNLEQSHELQQANFRIGNDGELYVYFNIELQYNLYLTSISKRTTFTPITPVVGYSLEEIEATTKAAVVELSLKQNKDDEDLQTTDKTVVGAINEVKTQVDGKIDGPSSSTDNAIARFDGITGKVVQDSNVLIDDSGNVVISGTVDGRDIAADGSKLDGIELGAQVNVNADWNSVSGDSEILNKPTDVTDLSAHVSSELSDGADLVKGPASATDNTLPRFNLTTGKLLQAGGSITNLDNGNVGIANNNPTDKLHVIGNIRSSAEVHAGTKVVIAGKVAQDYDSVNQSLKFNFL